MPFSEIDNPRNPGHDTVEPEHPSEIHNQVQDVQQSKLSRSADTPKPPDPISPDGTVNFGNVADIYPQSQKKPAPVGSNPFSPEEIANAGIDAGTKLEHNDIPTLDPEAPPKVPKGVHRRAPSSINDLVKTNDTPEQLAKDVAALKNAGAAGGVQQLGLGDCWYQSSVAAFASFPNGADAISKMITQEPDWWLQSYFSRRQRSSSRRF